MNQLALPLQLPAARPLVPMEACMVLLDRNEDELLSLVETGDMAWAWDIRSEEATRREIRVWRGSLLAHMRQEADEEDEEIVLSSLLPHSRETIRSTELQRLFSASQTHIQNLINQGALREDGMRETQAGPNAFCRVSRQSIINFLKERRVS